MTFFILILVELLTMDTQSSPTNNFEECLKLEKIIGKYRSNKIQRLRATSL